MIGPIAMFLFEFRTAARTFADAAFSVPGPAKSGKRTNWAHSMYNFIRYPSTMYNPKETLLCPLQSQKS